ncbi:MAG TPA: NADH-quinone oxidoreductase subunit H [Elusimicrobiota bacterium]|nr:NADH-quinone oxidoreductase subunit H [Elusimicrobiota bacterium]
MNPSSLLCLLAAWTLSPLLLGIINRTKAVFAGRRGSPLLQPYHDLLKLFRKDLVISRTTTWVFVAGPLAGCAILGMSTFLIPFGGSPSILRFSGDMILFAYLLGLARFMTVLAALDTGSSFEGMGASREVQFSALAEPTLFLALAGLTLSTGELSLSGLFSANSTLHRGGMAVPLALIAVALFILFLAENARIPVDDPNTHLELTMIHEVMVLDHSGPLLGLIQYGAALKLWVLGAILWNTLWPFSTGHNGADAGIALVGMMGLAVGVGVVESVMARLRLLRVPALLTGAGALALISLIFIARL